MSLSSQDFSSERLAKRPISLRLWLLAFVLHVVAIAGLNAVLTLNRLAAQEEASFDVAILPNDALPQKARSAKPESAKPQPDKPQPNKPEIAKQPEETAKSDAPPNQSQEPKSELEPVPAPTATALPTPQSASVPLSINNQEATSTPTAAPTAAQPATPASQTLQGLKAAPPMPVLLRYVLTKGSDSAKASLSWKPANPQASGANAQYEAVFEATYFGISVIKQTSQGAVGAGGLMPTRYADKRRGKSEQAAHFDREKSAVIFSNNRPDAKLTIGAQDRASFLVQLASLYAGQPERFNAGQVIELPVVSADELEMWAFEIGAQELMQLPIGQVEVIKLFRRPRRAFDIGVEVWLAPKMDYLPVRLRQADSGGVTDSQLVSKE